MIHTAKVIAIAVFLAAVCCEHGQGQVAAATILQIDTENQVQYVEDISDASQFATDPSVKS